MASKPTYPRRETDFLGWSAHYVQEIESNPEHYYLTDQEVAELKQQQQAFDSSYAAHVAASDEARAATQAKNEARSALEHTVRSTAKRIMADDRISDFERKEAGLPVHKTSRTPVPAPSTAPMGNVVATDRLEHRVLVTDSETPTKRRKPEGVIGCEAFLLVDNAMSRNPEDYKLIGLWTRYPEIVTFDAADAGKTANYVFRWLNTRGERGPWSEVTSATIPAV